MAQGNNDEQMKKNVELKSNYDTNELFDNLLDQFAPDHDDNYQDIVDLDFLINMTQRQQQQQAEEEQQLIEHDDDDDDDDSETSMSVDETEECQMLIEDEQVLSQKLSQLSTSKQNDDDDDEMSTENKTNKRSHANLSSPAGLCVKKMKTQRDNEENFEHSSIPFYLSPSNKSFHEMIEQEQWFKNDFHRQDEDDLRHIAILMHQIALNDLQRDLWCVYVQCGTGRLQLPKENVKSTTSSSSSEGLHIWPVKVKSLALSNRPTTYNTIAEKDQDQACLTFAHRFIENLNKQHDQYLCQLNERKANFLHFTDAINKCLETFIEQKRIHYLRLKCELKKALLVYSYFDQTFQWQYRQQHPSEHQIDIAEQVYKLKFDLEAAKQQVILLKQRISYQMPLKSFASIDRSLACTFHTIEDATIRQRLTDQQEKMIQQAKTDMFAILIARAEATVRQCQHDFDIGLAKFWQDYRQSSTDQQLTQTMIDAIDQRFAGVIVRFQAILDFKIKYFFSQAPTAVNITMKM